ncbi:hypothetical protein SCHPADRAFT_947188 [Schizopora paradoxa]|uniref:DUF6532 domain-containing protein n=1 Tax=Schizopora paradoxa TaxID=27342 RepID=A0A0H2R001_9AGAM|nr:hypothetical protein SCHPADRAFT_947188 [Schizopora paradoxa]
MTSTDTSATEASDPPRQHGMRTRGNKWNSNPVLAALTAELDKPKRRTTAQVKADNEAKEKAQRAAEDEMQERVKKIARIELETLNEDETRKKAIAPSGRRRGRPKGSGKKTKQTLKEPEPVVDPVSSSDLSSPPAQEPALPTPTPHPPAFVAPAARADAETPSIDVDMDAENPVEDRRDVEEENGEYQRALTEEPEEAPDQDDDEQEEVVEEMEEDKEDEMDVEDVGANRKEAGKEGDEDLGSAGEEDGSTRPKKRGGSRKKQVDVRGAISEAHKQLAAETEAAALAKGSHSELPPASSAMSNVSSTGSRATAASSGSNAPTATTDISSWRLSVKPGGEHVADVSDAVAKVSVRAVRPTDSVSQTCSPGSSVISSVVQKATASRLSKSTLSNPPSMVVTPPSPSKSRVNGQKSTAESGINIRVRSAADSLQAADAEEGRSRVRQRSSSQSSAKSSGGSKYTNADLPFDLGTVKKADWRNTFCPTFFQYIGTVADPWTIEVEYIQQIWDICFADLKYKVEGVGAVFSIVSQRVCEWRGKLAREALTIIKEHFDSDDFKDDNGQPKVEAIATYANHMLEYTDGGYRFVYQDTKNQYFAFRHPFIAKLMGLHLQAINGSVGMDSFGPEEDFRPLGALVVCSVAVHRALKLYTDGTPPKSIGDFSADSVLSVRDEFAEFIDLDGEHWEKVLEEASKHVPKGSRRSSTRHVVQKAPVQKRAKVRSDPVL